MKIHRLVIAPLLAAGATAAIAAAPIAAAAGQSHQNCMYSGDGTSLCASSGNAQIVATPSDRSYQSWDYYPYGGNLIVLGGHQHHGR